MKAWLRKPGAVVEVFLVALVLVPLLTLSLALLFPQLEDWQIATLGLPFPVLTHVVMMGVPLLVLLVRRRRPAEYGLTFANPRYHLDIAASCFIPVVLANAPFGLGADQRTWGGAFILALAQIALLVSLAWLLRNKPSRGSLSVAGAGLLVMPGLAGTADSTAGNPLALFLAYALFVGFGEEILYRGYMHSRLNEAFGRPYTFGGVSFGWGAVITALLFGFSHVGVLGWVLGLSAGPTLAWGFAAFFVGLVLGFVREKSGSILAPALLHGLPQAIATMAMLYVGRP